MGCATGAAELRGFAEATGARLDLEAIGSGALGAASLE